MDLDSIKLRCREIHDLENYYGEDREQKRERLIKEVLDFVDPLIDQCAGSEKGHAICAKGYALSWTPKKAQAEELLSKAIKLDPTMELAWNRLGEMCCERGDAKQALVIFEQALDQAGKSALLLRNISITLRAIDENRTLNFTKALQYAKDAITVDLTDPISWETLGNAYFGDFFLHPCPDSSVLKKVLSAYEKAEKFYGQGSMTSAVLFRNRGVVYKFTEKYAPAIADFKLAALLGGTEFKDCLEEADSCARMVRQIAGLCSSQGRVKPKKLQILLRNVDTCHSTLDEMKVGQNAGANLACNIFSVFARPSEVPLKIICHDRKGAFFCLSIYNCDYNRTTELLRHGEGLTVNRPHLRQIVLNDFSYNCIFVGHPGDITLRGQGRLNNVAVATHFSQETVEN